MDIAIPIFDEFTALDAVGPYEVLSPPARRRRALRRRRGRPDADRQRHAAARSPTHASTTSPHPDVVVVPGGIGVARCSRTTRACSTGCAPRTRRATWTTSVCTGSLAARRRGPARRPATRPPTGCASRRCAASAREPTGERVVRAGQDHHRGGRVVRHRHGADARGARSPATTSAQAIQLVIEYDPQPPFDAGSVDKAEPQVIARLEAAIRAREKAAAARAAAAA